MSETIEFAVGPLTFDQWLDAVDVEVSRLAGAATNVDYGRDDFRDWDYAVAFDEGIEPVKAAREMLAEDDLGAEILRHCDRKGLLS